MTFKEALQNDIKNVFLNPEEFGEMHKIGDKEVCIIIDENEMLEREKRINSNVDCISRKQILIYVNEEDFGKLPINGSGIILDDKKYIVLDAMNEGRIYAIHLEANVSNGNKYRT